jgi:uncharacterized protein YbbK (DUF523 family)
MDTGIDHTERMQRWAESRLANLAEDDMCGFVFKSASPSSSLHGVRVHNEKGIPSRRGVGMFACAFTWRFPLLPVEDDGRLDADRLRDVEHRLHYYRQFWTVQLEGLARCFEDKHKEDRHR